MTLIIVEINVKVDQYRRMHHNNIRYDEAIEQDLTDHSVTTKTL